MKVHEGHIEYHVLDIVRVIDKTEYLYACVGVIISINSSDRHNVKYKVEFYNMNGECETYLEKQLTYVK